MIAPSRSLMRKTMWSEMQSGASGYAAIKHTANEHSIWYIFHQIVVISYNNI